MDNEIILFEEKQYELKFNEKNIETVEAITKKPFMDVLISGSPVFSLSDLRQYFANGLYAVEGGRIPVRQGSAVFEGVLNEKGFAFINMLVINTIQRDCPFFFLED